MGLVNLTGQPAGKGVPPSTSTNWYIVSSDSDSQDYLLEGLGLAEGLAVDDDDASVVAVNQVMGGLSSELNGHNILLPARSSHVRSVRLAINQTYVLC